MTEFDAALERHLTHARAGGRSRRTITDRGKVLRRVDSALPYGLLDADAEDIAAWLSRPDWSAQTKCTYLNHIRAFLGWAADNGLVDDDPTGALIRPRIGRRLPRPAPTEVLTDILTRAAEPWRRHCLLAAYQGLRSSEIGALRREDVTIQHMIVRGKGDKVRVLPTHPLVWDDLRELPRGLVSPVPAGLRVDADTWVSCRTARYLHDRLGVDPAVSLHSLRHWFGTETLRACHDLRVVQELMGHASPTTTAIYTLVSDEERRAAITALPTFTDRTAAAS